VALVVYQVPLHQADHKNTSEVLRGLAAPEEGLGYPRS